MLKQVKAKIATHPYAENAINSTRSLWLAGLGAFATVQTEGGRVFNDLVKEGASVEAKGFKMANDGIEKTIATGSQLFAKVREGFETRVAQPMNARVGKGIARFGLPARNDLVVLTQRVEELSQQVRALRA